MVHLYFGQGSLNTRCRPNLFASCLDQQIEKMAPFQVKGWVKANSPIHDPLK